MNSARKSPIFPLWQPSLPRTFNSWWSDLPAEFHLMLACLRLSPTAKDIRQLAGLSRSGIHWPDFLRLVERHRTTPLVYQNLRRHGDSVPSSALSLLRSRFEANVRQNLANAAELVRLGKLFQENDIPFIPLKGSVLASQVYGNLALRHAGDIDLWVDPRRVERADQLLQTGYRRLIPGVRLTPLQQQRCLSLMNHFEYLHQQGNLRLELHWRPIQDQTPDRQSFSQLSGQATTIKIGEATLPTLSLQDNILYLCGHGWHHFWFRVFWLVDLAEIIRQNRTIDWHQLMTLANTVGLLPQLVLGVGLAHKLLDAPLPEPVQVRLEQDTLVSYAAWISCSYMRCPDPYDPPVSLRLHSFAGRIRGAPSLVKKLSIVKEILLGYDWLTISLPDALFFLHYFMRHFRWLQRQVGRKPQ